MKTKTTKKPTNNCFPSFVSIPTAAIHFFPYTGHLSALFPTPKSPAPGNPCSFTLGLMMRTGGHPHSGTNSSIAGEQLWCCLAQCPGTSTGAASCPLLHARSCRATLCHLRGEIPSQDQTLQLPTFPQGRWCMRHLSLRRY